MSDEALDAHLQWLDDCARAQVVDYETWLEGRVAQLEAENETLKRENGRLRGFLDTIMLNWEKHRVYKTLLTAEEQER